MPIGRHGPGGPRGFGHGPGRGFGHRHGRPGPGGFGHRHGGLGHRHGGFHGPRRGFGPPPPPPPPRRRYGCPMGCLGCGGFLFSVLAAVGGIVAAMLFLF